MANDDQLVELERLAKEAPVCPFFRKSYGPIAADLLSREIERDTLTRDDDRVLGRKAADFIAGANPSVVLSLIADLKRARAERDDLRKWNKRLCDELEESVKARDAAVVHERRMVQALDDAIRIYPSLADMLDAPVLAKLEEPE